MLVPECLLIEPTETESKEDLDAFVAAMNEIQQEAETRPDRVKERAAHPPVRRLDEVRAAKHLDLVWSGPRAGAALYGGAGKSEPARRHRPEAPAAGNRLTTRGICRGTFSSTTRGKRPCQR